MSDDAVSGQAGSRADRRRASRPPSDAVREHEARLRLMVGRECAAPGAAGALDHPG